MKKYENIYIYTDVDGTISTWNFEIPQKNIEAVKYFTENGGHFGIATGRGKNGVVDLPIAPYLNMPCILGNGAIITNLDEESPVHAEFLPKRAREIALEMRDKYPTLGIYCWGISKRYDMSDKNFCKREDKFKNNVVLPIEKVTEPWSRLLFYTDPEMKAEVMAYLHKLAKGEIEITTSGKACVGMMAKGVNKGIAVKEMIDKFSIERSNLYICGDFDNDIPMLTLENTHTFCPENAEKCVKEAAGKILCHVDDSILPLVLKEIDKNL